MDCPSKMSYSHASLVLSSFEHVGEPYILNWEMFVSQLGKLCYLKGKKQFRGMGPVVHPKMYHR